MSMLYSTVAAVRGRDFCSEINHNANYSGFTPLHYGVVVDDEELIQYLLENGTCSCTGWCISITASFLLSSLYSGADPTIEDNAGYFPKDYCTNQTVKDLLAKYAVKVSKVSTRME